MSKDIRALNNKLNNKLPTELIKWGIERSENPILTTNFGPYEITILHLCVVAKPDIKIVWCDSGYNTKATYNYARKIISELRLNIKIYVPLNTAAYRSSYMPEIPNIDSPLHNQFTEEVKLEPFRRAMAEIKPDLWITNLRKGQTTFRDTINIVSESEAGLLKLSPFYNWSDKKLDRYIKENKLENEFDYFDPTKGSEKRECGLHGK